MSLKLLCDENISGEVFASLHQWGFNVSKASPGISDAEIAAIAKREERVILTFDSDFANILAYPPKEFFGIIRIRIHPPFNKIVMIMLNNLFNQFKTPKDFAGKLIIVEAAAFRVLE